MRSIDIMDEGKKIKNLGFPVVFVSNSYLWYNKSYIDFKLCTLFWNIRITTTIDHYRHFLTSFFFRKLKVYLFSFRKTFCQIFCKDLYENLRSVLWL